MARGLLGELSYDTTPRAYVAPPTKERKELFDTVENQYLVGRENKNALDAYLRTLPSNLSPEIYNNLVNTVKPVLDSVNSDNYRDKLMDVTQLANDIENKLGGRELVQQAAQASAALATYDKALEEGKIVDPQMAQWYKGLTQANIKPLTKDENGFISKPNVTPVPFAEYTDIQKNMDAVLKGWEADGTFSKNADGTFRVNRSVPGILDYTETESVSADEIREASMKYIQNDEKAMAYLNDKARFDTRNIMANGDTFAQILSPELKQKITGNPNATALDLDIAIREGKFDPNATLQNLYKNREVINKSEFGASKYGFTKEGVKTLEDKLLIASLEAQQKIYNKSAEAEMVQDNVSVTVNPFTPEQILNPTDVAQIKVAKSKLKEDRNVLQKEINDYQKNITAGLSGADSEQLDILNARQTIIDDQIAEISRQERELTKVIYDNGKKAGVNLDTRYSMFYNDSVEQAQKENTLGLDRLDRNRADVSFDLTSSIVNRNGKQFIKIKEGDKIVEKEVDNLQGVTREGGRVVYKSKNSTGYGKRIVEANKEAFFGKDGSVNTAVVKIPEGSEKGLLYRVPSKSEYGSMMVEGYNNKETYSNGIGIDKSNFKDEENGLILSNIALHDLNKIREKQGDFEWTISRPLNHLMVTGETTKHSLKAYTEMENNIRSRFLETPEQFKISSVDGSIIDMSDYIGEKFDIDPKYIDWKSSSIVPTIESNRKHGQMYGVSIKLTAEGVKELGSDEAASYARTNGFKVITVNPDSNERGESEYMRNTLLEAYRDVTDSNTPHSMNIRQDMGIVYLNNSPEGKAIDRLNLYTQSAGGDPAIWKVRDGKGGMTDYQITTTAKSANASDLMNVDYHLGKIENNTQMVLAVSADGKQPAQWKPLSEVNGSKEWNKVRFDTPTDIKGVVGKTLLDHDFKNKQQQATGTAKNAYAEFLQSVGYTQKENQTISTNYSKQVRTVQSQYDTPSLIKVLDNKGNKQTIESRVPASELADLRVKYPSNVASNNTFPYVNKGIMPNVDKVLATNNLTMTDGFRGEQTHKTTAKGSLHKYGQAVDFRANAEGLAFFDKVNGNADLMKQYGILNILKHGEGSNLHVHVEFNRDFN